MTRAVRGAGELEAAVMEVVWDAGRPIRVREVLDQLAGTAPGQVPAYTTVMTVLDRLFAKQWVTREPVGHAYAYSPVQTREEHIADLMSQALSDSSDRLLALEHFAAALPDNELDALKRALGGRPRRRRS
ncbi:MAG TPA: BlaI/MecI/CopY family transcriptional regulator [Marmoricola sp.]|nr:BlaI/MecI/CopY family transcriptional regulator [Marmoricola sp.]